MELREKGLFKRISQLINRERERGSRPNPPPISFSEKGEDWFEDKTAEGERLREMCALLNARAQTQFLRRETDLSSGPCTYDVCRTFGILDPPSPCPHFTQPISTGHPQN